MSQQARRNTLRTNVTNRYAQRHPTSFIYGENGMRNRKCLFNLTDSSTHFTRRPSNICACLCIHLRSKSCYRLFRNTIRSIIKTIRASIQHLK